MKNALLLACCLVSFLCSDAQICRWAKQSSGESNNGVVAIAATGGAGYVVEAGIYTGTQITFGTDTLANPDSTTFRTFLVKYANTGAVVWARSYGGSKNTMATDIATDNLGNVYLYGNYTDSILTFDGITLLNDSARRNLFLVKVNNTGSVVWAKNIHLHPRDTFVTNWASKIAVNGGHVAITGSFDNAITFGTLSRTYSNPLGTAMFIAEYDTSGSALWATNSLDTQPSTYSDAGSDVAFDASGNIYVCGRMQGDSVAFSDTVYVNAPAPGSLGFFLVKYNSSGAAIWAAGENGTVAASAYPAAITTDISGNVYMGGNFGHALTIGSTTLTNATTTGNTPDIFVASYSSTGSPRWAKSFTGDTLTDYFGDMVADEWGRVFVSGVSQALPFAYDGHDFTESGMFMAALDNATGNATWWWNAATANGNRSFCTGMAHIPGDWSLYASGDFQQSVSIDITDFSGTPTTTTLSTPITVYQDAFLLNFQIMSGDDVKDIVNGGTPIKLYPNPATKEIMLSSDAEIISYVVTDCRGEQVLGGEPAAREAEVNTANLAPGLYFVTVKTKEGVVVEKFVKLISN